MTSIVLVRHAATTWSGRRYCGRADPPLSALGREMARTLAADLAPTLPGNTRILSSPSRRARDTASAIAMHLASATVDVDAGWLETDVGLAEGLTFDEVAARWPELGAALVAGETAIDWPGGETALELERRIAGAWATVVASGGPTVVVSHAGSLRVAMAIATGREVAEIGFLQPGGWSRHEIARESPPAAGIAPEGRAAV